jgi:multicomponent Na+:H+ antiporter subunit D
MTIEWLHPGLVLILGAWLVPLCKGRLRRAVLVLVPLAAFVDCVLMTRGTYGSVNVQGLELVFGRVDSLSLVFAYVFSLMALLGTIYALHVDDDVQHVSALTYAGGALGVTFAGDMLSLYIFWELMALSSVLLVWCRRSPAATAAGFRYVLVHIVGGLVLLAGILLQWWQSGSLAFEDMLPWSGSLAWALILIAFLLNAAVPPLGAWLPDAYPQATVTGAVFMTAFTTKSAVYTLIRAYPQTELLMWLGAAMALYGVVYAVLENDARRLLAYHIISQVGYMVCGVGIGTTLATNGATAHAFAHILYKGLLFMGAGAVLQMTGLRKLSEMGGLYKTMPITLGFYMIGACAISAVPLFSGFVTKSMVVSAAGESHHAAIFLMLTLASAGTFLHTGLKLPYYMFFGQDSGRTLPQGSEPPRNMLIAMGLAALACVLIGVFPGLLYRHLPGKVDYVPYTLQHVTSTLGMLAFTALGFFLLLRQLDPKPTVSRDTDWFYRRPTALLVQLVRGPLTRFEYGFVGQVYEFLLRRPVLGLAALLRRFDSGVVDRAVVGVGNSVRALSRVSKGAVSGHTQHYGMLMAAGLIVVLGLVMLIR